MDVLRLGVAQLFIADSLSANEQNMEKMVTSAADRGVDLLAFPEMSLTGYNPATLGQPGIKTAIAEALTGLSRLASALSIGLIAGHAVFDGDKLYNCASVLLPGGVAYTYRKINLTAAEDKFFSPGNTPLVFTYKGRRFGVIICRDQNYPALATRLREEGAQAMFILAAHYYPPGEARWKLPKNCALPIARAVENGMYVLLANAVGSHIGMVSLGNSLIADPDGAVVCQADEVAETILTCDLRGVCGQHA